MNQDRTLPEYFQRQLDRCMEYLDPINPIFCELEFAAEYHLVRCRNFVGLS